MDYRTPLRSANTPKQVRSAAYSSDGRHIVTGSLDGTVRLWNADTLDQVTELYFGFGWITSVAFSPDSSLFVAARTTLTDEDRGVLDKPIAVWRTSDHSLVKRLNHPQASLGIAFLPDSRRILLATYAKKPLRVPSTPFGPLSPHALEGLVRLWDIVDDHEIVALPAGKGLVSDVAYAPHRSILAAALDDSSIRIWHLNHSEPVHTMLGHEGVISSIDFSPDGSVLASCGEDKSIIIWSAGDGRRLFELGPHSMGHLSWVRSLSFFPQGYLLASCGEDDQALIWDTRDRSVIARLGPHSGGVMALATGPDGRKVVTGDGQGTVRTWDLLSG
jgi:WD40 repeat protein